MFKKPSHYLQDFPDLPFWLERSQLVIRFHLPLRSLAEAMIGRDTCNTLVGNFQGDTVSYSAAYSAGHPGPLPGYLTTSTTSLNETTVETNIPIQNSGELKIC